MYVLYTIIIYMSTIYLIIIYTLLFVYLCHMHFIYDIVWHTPICLYKLPWAFLKSATVFPNLLSWFSALKWALSLPHLPEHIYHFSLCCFVSDVPFTPHSPFQSIKNYPPCNAWGQMISDFWTQQKLPLSLPVLPLH